MTHIGPDQVARLIVDIPDYPKPGVVFKDLTPIFSDADALDSVCADLAEIAAKLGVTKVAGIEARGFILGAAVAVKAGLGFIPIRKAGKLPRATYKATYELEYGTDAVEIHQDALSTGDTVFIIDDVLATGGTANAAIDVIEQSGARVAGLAVLLELGFLGGRERISAVSPHVAITTYLHN